MATIVYNLTPVFHIVFRDQLGQPASNGTVETFKASAHTVQKAVYEDRQGTIPFPNPIPLNAAGVVADATGAPKPIYWADDEDYYVVVKDQFGNTIQTIDNYNSPVKHKDEPVIEEVNLKNYIPNPQFEQLNLDITKYDNASLPSSTAKLIAREGWYFFRDTANSQNQIEFNEFSLGQTDVPFNPKRYLNFLCSVNGVETQKDIYVDIGDVLSFSNQELTFAFYGKSSTSSTISLVLIQDFSTGGSPTVETIPTTFTLGSDWAQYQATFTVPDISGKTLGTDGNDRFRIALRMPLNLISNIDLVNFQLNIGDTLLDFAYTTSLTEKRNANAYQLPTPTEEDAFKSISLASDKTTYEWQAHPPVGSVLSYAGEVVPDGYLECNGQPHSGVEGSIFHNLWNVIGNRFGFGNDSGGIYSRNNTANLIRVFILKKDTNVTDIADVNTGFTFTKIRDGGDIGFETRTALSLPRYLDPKIDITRVTNKANGAVTASAAGTSGFTITQIQAGSGSLPEITDITTVVASGLAGKHFLISSTSTDYYVWFKVDGVGTDPAVGGRTGLEIALLGNEDARGVSTAIFWALGGCEQSTIACNSAGTLTAGDHFTVHNQSATFVPWYRINGSGTAPSLSGTKIPVDVNSGDTAAQVAAKTTLALRSALFQTPDLRGQFVRGWSHGAVGIDPDRLFRVAAQDLITREDNIGTLQIDEFYSHRHDGVEGIIGGPGTGSFDLNVGTRAPGDLTNATGGNETRPINMYLMYIIKY